MYSTTSSKQFFFQCLQKRLETSYLQSYLWIIFFIRNFAQIFSMTSLSFYGSKTVSGFIIAMVNGRLSCLGSNSCYCIQEVIIANFLSYTLIYYKSLIQQLNNSYQMGSSQAIIQQNYDQNLIRQLKLSVQSSIKEGRLEWDRQTNIYQKTEYLVENFVKEYKSQIGELLLAYNMISEKYMQLLPKMDFQNIQVIKLSHNSINCDALKHIKTMKGINLKHFFLDHNQIGNDGCFYIMRMSLPMLQTLDLSNNMIENEGAKHLCKATMPDLRTLLICQNKLTEKGLMILGTGQWPLLSFVRARKNQYSQTKQLQFTKFRTQIKFFRLQVQ